MNLTLICATSISRTNDVKLDELISRLRTKDMVDSVLVMGSAEEGNFRPYSDYDIAIVMRRKARPVLSSLLTTIDGHVGDVYFFYPDELSRVPRGRTVVDLSLKSSWLIGWLRSGRIAFDKSGLLTRLAAETQSVILQVPDERKYRAWYRVNYNYAHNYRMFRSGDPTYVKAVQIRLLYALPELLTCYMDLRGITWQGEKQAVKYLETANPGFLSDFFKCIQSTVMTEKMRLYKGLLIEATKPAGPVWNQTTAAVSTGEPFGLSDATDALRLWEKLTE